jgi:hypothetical protein
LYLQTFMKEQFEPATAQQTATERFEELYRARYGRYKFWAPFLLFGFTTFIATALLSESAIGWIQLETHQRVVFIGAITQGLPLFVIPQVAAAGIGGAYIWIVSDMIARARRLDLSPADILNATLRMAMSAALAVAVVQLAAPALALPLAFAIGAFPLDTVRAMLRRLVSDKLGLGVGIEDDSTDQVFNIDSVDHPTADRLLDADISTIAQLAYADPVQLCMRTGLGFDFVIDIVSQALAWIYLGDRLDDLRPAGLRGAMEIHSFLAQLSDPAQPIYALMTAVLAVVPGLPQDTVNPPRRRKMDAAQFLNACDEIANDPYTQFLVEIWRDGRSTASDVAPNYAALLKPAPA